MQTNLAPLRYESLQVKHNDLKTKQGNVIFALSIKQFSIEIVIQESNSSNNRLTMPFH
jgi:hypothetical protein